jgi:hypothetical protein
MWISLALNAALSLGIITLLSTAEAQTSNLKLCGYNPMVLTAAEIAQAGKVRYKVLAEVAQPGNVMRKTATPTMTGATLPAVSYIRCLKS